jgi:hypothetical protein
MSAEQVVVVLAVLVTAAAGVALGMALADRVPARPQARPGAAGGPFDALRVQVLEADRAALRQRLAASQSRWARLDGDLNQVLAILHGPARDSELVKVAFDRLEVIRKGLA